MSTIIRFAKEDMKAAVPSGKINSIPEGDQAPATCTLSYANGGSNSGKKAAIAFVVHGHVDQGVFIGLDYFLALQKEAGVNLMTGNETDGYLPDFSNWMIGWSKGKLLFKPCEENTGSEKPSQGRGGRNRVA